MSAYDKNSKLGLGPGIAPHSLSQAFLFFFFLFFSSCLEAPTTSVLN